MRQKTCIVCGGAVVQILDLGIQAPANTLLGSPDEEFERYPLGLSVCERCTHGQLSDFVQPEALFREYAYVSGTSNTLRRYFDWLARRIAEFVPQEARILELASNDGSFLSALQAAGLTAAVGVDPAEALSHIARAAGHEVVTGFFPQVSPPGPFDVIVGMNVAAHTPAPAAFMRGVADRLAPAGVALIQTSQARMIENAEFDTIYHEHYSFYTVESMRELAARAGMRVEAVHLATVHGTSFVFVLRRADAPPGSAGLVWEGEFAVTGEGGLDSDTPGGAHSAGWTRFAERSQAVIASAGQRIAQYREEGYRIGLVGVAAKAMTFIRAAGIEPDDFFDEAELKIGRYIPGYRTPILPLEAVTELPQETVLVIGAWNFADELTGKIMALPLRGAPRFLTYFPELTELEPRGI